MDTSSRWCARALRSRDSCRPSRARACRFSTTRLPTATSSSSITSSSRHTSPKRHDEVRHSRRSHLVNRLDRWLTPSPLFYRFSQVLPRRFMGRRIEINPNYRLICDYCIPFTTLHLGHSGNPMHKLWCMNMTPDGTLGHRVCPLSSFTLNTTVLHCISATSRRTMIITTLIHPSGRTRRTVKKKNNTGES